MAVFKNRCNELASLKSSPKSDNFPWSTSRTMTRFLGMPCMKLLGKEWIQEVLYWDPAAFPKAITLPLDHIFKRSFLSLRVQYGMDGCKWVGCWQWWVQVIWRRKHRRQRDLGCWTLNKRCGMWVHFCCILANLTCKRYHGSLWMGQIPMDQLLMYLALSCLQSCRFLMSVVDKHTHLVSPQ